MALKSVVQTARLHGWAHDDLEEARQEIMDALGDLSGLNVWRTQCVIADYLAPEKLKSGLITPHSLQEEDIFQGKAGMLVWIGAQAFAPRIRNPVTGEW